MDAETRETLREIARLTTDAYMAVQLEQDRESIRHHTMLAARFAEAAYQDSREDIPQAR